MSDASRLPPDAGSDWVTMQPGCDLRYEHKLPLVRVSVKVTLTTETPDLTVWGLCIEKGQYKVAKKAGILIRASSTRQGAALKER